MVGERELCINTGFKLVSEVNDSSGNTDHRINSDLKENQRNKTPTAWRQNFHFNLCIWTHALQCYARHRLSPLQKFSFTGNDTKKIVIRHKQPTQTWLFLGFWLEKHLQLQTGTCRASSSLTECINVRLNRKWWLRARKDKALLSCRSCQRFVEQ